MADSFRTQAWLRLGVLLVVHSVVCCTSLAYLAPYHAFHLYFDVRQLLQATLVVGVFATLALLFIFADFSFGYYLGFHFYTAILGYLWIGTFSDLKYNHLQAQISAGASALAFLLPALLVSQPIHPFTMSQRAFSRLLTLILVAAVVTIAGGALYNFRVVGISEIYNFRNELSMPLLIKYAVGLTSTVLLPFAFACFLARKAWWRAGAALVLLLLFYPITLSKLALFAPFWLVVIAVLGRHLEIKTAVILSMTLPLTAGLILMMTVPAHAYPLSHLFNMRVAAIPSIAMDIYNDFFAYNDLTYFCQISFAKSFVSCPYQAPLSVVMEQNYNLGNFNASMFATEGIASVGPTLAPLSALVCGLIIAIGNRTSAGLAPQFVLVSSCVLVQAFLNVPLTTALLTHGAAVLFLLWYVMPRPPEMSIQQESQTNDMTDAIVDRRA